MLGGMSRVSVGRRFWVWMSGERFSVRLLSGLRKFLRRRGHGGGVQGGGQGGEAGSLARSCLFIP